jgi:hypothetical protein
MWWQPGSIAVAGRGERVESSPAFFRINIESLSGHRGTDEAPASPGEKSGGWLSRLFRPTEMKR